VCKFEDGAEFYESALHRTTTTNMSAKEIHDIGLKEIARIHDEMNKIREKIGFKGDLQAFFKLMREDQHFRLPGKEQGCTKYLAMAADIIETMKKRLDEFFVTKPKADIVVKAVESFREKSAGKSFLSATGAGWNAARDVLRERAQHAGQSNCTNWKRLPIMKAFPAITCKSPLRRS
jgi:uncharacterized protein (DUF885 family)